MRIIADSPTPEKSKSANPNGWIRTGDLFNRRLFPPDKGFIQLPFSLLQSYGVARTHTLAALMQTPGVQRTGTTDARQDSIAYWGCIALRTFERQLAECQALGLVSNPGRVSHGRAYLTLAPDIRAMFGRESAGYRLQLPKEWFARYEGTAVNATDLALYAYYRFRSNEGRSFCTDTFGQIADSIGGSERSWRRSAEKLHARGMIKRAEMKRRNFSVTLPSNPYDFPDCWQERQAIGQEIIDHYADCYASRFDVLPAMATGEYSKSAILDAFDLYRTLGRDIERVKRWVAFIVGSWDIPGKLPTFRRIASPDTVSQHAGSWGDST